LNVRLALAVHPLFEPEPNELRLFPFAVQHAMRFGLEVLELFLQHWENLRGLV
jgi:hypothetical protein